MFDPAHDERAGWRRQRGRNRGRSLELKHLRTVHDHIISVAKAHADAVAASAGVFQVAAASSSHTAKSAAIAFCSMLHDTYARSQEAAVTALEGAMSAASVAASAVFADPSQVNRAAVVASSREVASRDAHVAKVAASIAATKSAMCVRIVELFPDAGRVLEAARIADISPADTVVVVMGGCFDVVEHGLCQNALTRGPVGPECPVCYEELDTTSEQLPRSLLILECLLPKDYAHGPMHHMCRGCWASIVRQATKNKKQPKCPSCRSVTVGRTVSQCAYGIMSVLMVP